MIPKRRGIAEEIVHFYVMNDGDADAENIQITIAIPQSTGIRPGDGWFNVLAHNWTVIGATTNLVRSFGYEKPAILRGNGQGVPPVTCDVSKLTPTNSIASGIALIVRSKGAASHSILADVLFCDFPEGVPPKPVVIPVVTSGDGIAIATINWNELRKGM
jgi:hypothetical protein